MAQINLKVAVWKEDKHYVAWCLNNGISSFGDSRKGALASLEEALELYFEDVSADQVSKVERPDIVPMKFKYA